MAKKVYYNGYVYTVDKDRTVASAVVIDGDRIEYVGDDIKAKAIGGADAEMIDLEGKMMLPGLIDGHCHPIMAANFLSGVVLDIDWTLEENLTAIREYVAAHPEKAAYVGIGYAEWLLDEDEPAKKLLDEICSDKPMIMFGSGGHEGWANSKTFELAGITKDTPDPVPGLHYFTRDEEGNPSGHIAESQALDMVCQKIGFFDKDALKDMLWEISRDYASYGVTTTADMGVSNMMGMDNYRAGLEIIRGGGYLQRFNGPAILFDTEGEEDRYLENCKQLRKEYDDDKVRVSLFKMIIDGTMESRTAALSEPYPGDGSVVKPLLDEKTMPPVMLKAAEAGFHINAHAIGDEAAKAVIAGAKAVREAGYSDTRITCSHCEYIQPEDVKAFALYDITANTTGVWFYGGDELDNVLGHIEDECFRMRSLKDAGARVAFGSDFPVDEHGNEPLKGMEMVVTRKMYDQPDGIMLKPYDEVLTVDDAIAGYTIHNAIQLDMEDRLGTIEPGKYADLVVLEKNLFEIPPEEIHRVKVCETIMGGNTIYKA